MNGIEQLHAPLAGHRKKIEHGSMVLAGREISAQPDVRVEQ